MKVPSGKIMHELGYDANIFRVTNFLLAEMVCVRRNNIISHRFRSALNSINPHLINKRKSALKSAKICFSKLMKYENSDDFKTI